MDSEYILPKLKMYAELMYGKKNKKYCFSRKKGKYYLFGYQKKKKMMINTISKELAIYLCIPTNYKKSKNKNHDNSKRN